MAPKEPGTSKAKSDKPVKAGVSKRSPKKTSPTKASPSKAPTAGVDRDLLFLWKCIKLSGGLKVSVSHRWATVSCVLHSSMTCTDAIVL